MPWDGRDQDVSTYSSVVMYWDVLVEAIWSIVTMILYIYARI